MGTVGWTANADRNNVSINAGGTGLLVAIGCCILVTAFFIAGAIVAGSMITDLKGEVRAMRATDETQQAYINLLMQERPAK